jgi:hypothetical protein
MNFPRNLGSGTYPQLTDSEYKLDASSGIWMIKRTVNVMELESFAKQIPGLIFPTRALS